jgi:putative iron-regulated protein
MLLVALLPACDGDDPGGLDDAHDVVATYAALASAGYADSLDGAETLRGALAAYVADPTTETRDAARAAWIDARLPYRQTEAFRFYGGPIDDPSGEPEGRINAWPLDEATIDYVEGNPDAGAINDLEAFPTIDADALLTANFQNGEADVKTGYHAIEFLLWGQDRSDTGPGDRPASDYVTDGNGTAANQDRRGAYLLVAADVLVGDLAWVADAWEEEAGWYREAFHAEAPEEALRRMLTGIGTLAASELSGERMLTAYENQDQEDEHSCFSDTTLDDILGNAQGIANVYQGRYGTIDGPGIDDLVAARDADLAAEMDARITEMLDAIEAIPGSFDQAIRGEDEDEGRAAVLAAVRAVQAVGESLNEVAVLLGIEIHTDL